MGKIDNYIKSVERQDIDKNVNLRDSDLLGSEENLYRCVHCGYTTRKHSVKKWIASYCVKTNREVHLMLL